MFHTIHYLSCLLALCASAVSLRSKVSGFPGSWTPPWAKKTTLEEHHTTAPKDAKNVIFILFDDLRSMHPSYGWNQSYLPNHERLMKESLVFDRAYVQQAVCGPSRASLLSGRRPDRTQRWNFMKNEGGRGFRAAPGADKWNTLPQHFANHGYYTAGAGKLYHLGDPHDLDPQSWTEPECKTAFPYSGQGSCPVDQESLRPLSPGCPVNTAKHGREDCGSRGRPCFPDVVALDKWMEFLHKGATQYKSKGQPFFLALGFVKPHLPHIYPKEFLDNVPALKNIILPPNLHYPEKSPAMEWVREGIQSRLPSPKYTAPNMVMKAFLRGYYAAAAFSDSLLGEVLDKVDSLGLKWNTIVVVTADNGYSLGEHNHFEKYTNFETDARVPLYVRAPWKHKAAGARAKTLVELVDLYPSVAQLAGIPVDRKKESIDGESWAHLLDEPGHWHKGAVFSQHPRCYGLRTRASEMASKAKGVFPKHDATDFEKLNRCTYGDPHTFSYMGYSIRTEKWRYTEWPAWDPKGMVPAWDHSVGAELYDHRGDPPENTYKSYTQFENVNVAATHQTVTKDLRQRLIQYAKASRALVEKAR